MSGKRIPPIEFFWPFFFTMFFLIFGITFGSITVKNILEKFKERKIQRHLKINILEKFSTIEESHENPSQSKGYI